MKMSLRDGLKLSLSLLTKRDQKLLFLAFLVQISLSVLDLIGIGAIAAVVAIAVSVIQNAAPPSFLLVLLKFLNIDQFDPYQIVVFLSVSALVLFTSKTLLTALITKRQLRFLANREAAVSTSLMNRLLNNSIIIVQEKPAQETINALLGGVSSATTQFLGNFLMVTSETALLSIVLLTLLIVNPPVAIGSVLLFGFVGFILYKILGRYAQRISIELNALAVMQASIIQVAITGFRELTVMNRFEFFNNRFSDLRWRGAQLSAASLFLAQISRYIFELTLVVGAFILAATQFLLNDALTAVTTLSLFLAAGTRVMPSLLKLQTGLVAMKGSLGNAHYMIELKSRLSQSSQVTQAQLSANDQIVRSNARDPYSIVIDNISFTYPEKSEPVLSSVSLTVSPGTSIGIVGSSGAGKSTLVDVILGVLTPSEGKVFLNGLPVDRIRENEIGAIGYVPQDITLIAGTIEENIALGLRLDQYEIEWVWDALESAQLASFVRSLPEQLKTQIGERGVRLSGGQRQRIGLARALLSKPSLLILDEATSSLDSETESNITESLKDLNQVVTKIVIAHRLATIRNLDEIYILEKGRIIHKGTYGSLKQLGVIE